MSYWKKAIEKHFPNAESVEEDWSNSFIRFEVFNAQLMIPKNLQVFGNDVTVRVEAVGDDRNRDRNGGRPEARLVVTLLNVRFPETPS